MGYTTLTSYNTTECAADCNKIDGCVAFNLYYERDPSLDPNAQSCPNPPSVTNIKCVFWGVPVSKATATNNGQFRTSSPPPFPLSSHPPNNLPGDSFQVVIAGSNGYNALPLPSSVPGFTLDRTFKGQLSFPIPTNSDPTNGYNTYIGAKFISFGAAGAQGQTQYYSAEICANACADQTAYNFGNKWGNGGNGGNVNPKVCNQVVGHSLSKNGVPWGMYCEFSTVLMGEGNGANGQKVLSTRSLGTRVMVLRRL